MIEQVRAVVAIVCIKGYLISVTTSESVMASEGPDGLDTAVTASVGSGERKHCSKPTSKRRLESRAAKNDFDH